MMESRLQNGQDLVVRIRRRGVLLRSSRVALAPVGTATLAACAFPASPAGPLGDASPLLEHPPGDEAGRASGTERSAENGAESDAPSESQVAPETRATTQPFVEVPVSEAPKADAAVSPTASSGPQFSDAAAGASPGNAGPVPSATDAGVGTSQGDAGLPALGPCAPSLPFLYVCNVAELNTEGSEATARLSLDGRAVLYSYVAPGAGFRYVRRATRAKADGAFGAPVALPLGNGVSGPTLLQGNPLASIRIAKEDFGQDQGCAPRHGEHARRRAGPKNRARRINAREVRCNHPSCAATQAAERKTRHDARASSTSVSASPTRT
jgi:hypothetical protein